MATTTIELTLTEETVRELREQLRRDFPDELKAGDALLCEIMFLAIPATPEVGIGHDYPDVKAVAFVAEDGYRYDVTDYFDSMDVERECLAEMAGMGEDPADEYERMSDDANVSP